MHQLINDIPSSGSDASSRANDSSERAMSATAPTANIPLGSFADNGSSYGATEGNSSELAGGGNDDDAKVDLNEVDETELETEVLLKVYLSFT